VGNDNILDEMGREVRASGWVQRSHWRIQCVEPHAVGREEAKDYPYAYYRRLDGSSSRNRRVPPKVHMDYLQVAVAELCQSEAVPISRALRLCEATEVLGGERRTSWLKMVQGGGFDFRNFSPLGMQK